MKLLEKYRAKQSIEEDNTIEVLAPIVLRKEEHSTYHCVEELRRALHHPDCYNIALTGVFGSGKSSVIKTLLKEEDKKYKYLRISLSSLLLNYKENAICENEIESKVFQQILFKASHKSTPKSKYNRSRIKHFKRKSTFMTALLCVLFLLCFIIVFEPKFLQVPSFYDLFNYLFSQQSGFWLNIITDIVASLYMIFIIIFCVAELIRCTCTISLKSIKAKEITLDFRNNKSAFKELLGEILYFFKAGEYNLIIFEDLDRIKEPQNLFLKFREINQLLNESDDTRNSGRKIQFIYAIRDDVFNEEVRTKFFDYIVPVVPVIDKFNAGDYLIKNYKDNGLENIDEKEISELGHFIRDTRELINIMNEYKVYRKVLIKGSMSQKKLLSSIIYKNKYPQDYSQFHKKEGHLYNVLFNKATFSDLLNKVDSELKVSLEFQIKQIREKIIDLRTKILDWLIENNQAFRLIFNDTPYNISEVVQKDDLFDLFENDKYNYYQRRNENEYRKYLLKFQDILIKIYPDNSYYEDMEEYQNDIQRLKSQLNECIDRLRLTNTKSINDIINEIGDGGKTLKLVEDLCTLIMNEKDAEIKISAPIEQVELIHALIKNGYIEEDINTYLAFSYPGTKSSADYEFLHSVLQGVGKPFSYKLDHAEEILKSLDSGKYSSKEILNFDLLEELIKSEDKTLLQPFITSIRQNLDFVVQYYEAGRVSKKFIELLFFKWDNCVDQIINQLNEDSNILFELLFTVSDTTSKLKDNEKSILNEKYSFLCEKFLKVNFDNLKSFINHYMFKFTHLVSPTENTRFLYDYVIKHSFFEINAHNLNIIYGEDFASKSYTTIRNGISEVKDYLLDDENIVDVIELFPDTDINEDVNAIRELSNNAKVSDEQFETFVKRQVNNLSNLDDIKVERISLFFKLDKLEATWTNIQHFFKGSDDMGLIRDYILKHIKDLENQKIAESEEKALQLFLMGDNNTLSISEFKKLLPCCQYPFEADEIEEHNEERLGIILGMGYVEYTYNTINLFASKSPDLFGEFLVYFFESFMNDMNFEKEIPIKTGIFILNSNLTLDQKKYYLDSYAYISGENDIEEYSRLICFYYGKLAINKNSNIDLLIGAMIVLTGPKFWKQKIDIINNINKNFAYDKTIETKLLNTLGGEYLKLNTYRGVAYFDINEENKTLLDYLESQGHYINKKIEENGQLKVTFKHPPRK